MASFNMRTTSWPSQFETLKPLVQLISVPYQTNDIISHHFDHHHLLYNH